MALYLPKRFLVLFKRRMWCVYGLSKKYVINFFYRKFMSLENQKVLNLNCVALGHSSFFYLVWFMVLLQFKYFPKIKKDAGLLHYMPQESPIWHYSAVVKMSMTTYANESSNLNKKITIHCRSSKYFTFFTEKKIFWIFIFV